MVHRVICLVYLEMIYRDINMDMLSFWELSNSLDKKDENRKEYISDIIDQKCIWNILRFIQHLVPINNKSQDILSLLIEHCEVAACSKCRNLDINNGCFNNSFREVIKEYNKMLINFEKDWKLK